VFSGRAAPLQQVDDQLNAVRFYGGGASEALVFRGVRGLGKTSLLRVVERRATEQGFIAASVTGAKNADLIAEAALRVELAASKAGVSTTRWRDRLTEMRLGWAATGPRAEATIDLADSGHTAELGMMQPLFVDLLETVSHAARTAGKAGLLLTVDEVQAASETGLNALARSVSDLYGSDAAVVVVGAGLPEAREAVMAAASSTERFRFPELDRLSPAGSHEALVAPALNVGVQWTSAAANAVVNEAQGYPHYLQLMGHETWELVKPEQGAIIPPAAAKAGIAAAYTHLEQGLFGGRWETATERQREMLSAIAHVVTARNGSPAPISEVMELMGVTDHRQLSPIRQALISKGLVAAAGHGALQFTVPGYASYVLRRSTADSGDAAPPQHPAAAQPSTRPADLGHVGGDQGQGAV
jgi:hypothetical protein